MANWPDSPSWSDPKTINSGNQYNAADGVLYTDMNKIISNLLYLKQRGGIIPTGTLSIVSNDTYDVTKYARVEVNVPQTGGGDQPQLNAPTISIAGTTLSIEDPATNGNFTSGWKLYDDGSYVDQFLTSVIQLANIQFGTGTHKLTVKSFGTNFKDSAASNEVTYQITEKLATPVVSISGSIINWELVPNASGYLISGKSLHGVVSIPQSVSAGTSSYDLKGWLSTSGTYTVTVTAKGSGDYIDSDPSNAVTYTNQEQLATPQNVTADGTTVSWDAVEHAEYYDIYADGTIIAAYTPKPSGYNLGIGGHDVFSASTDTIAYIKFNGVATSTDYDWKAYTQYLTSYVKDKNGNDVSFPIDLNYITNVNIYVEQGGIGLLSQSFDTIGNHNIKNKKNENTNIIMDAYD